MLFHSANLVSLRAALEPDDVGVPLTTLLRAPGGNDAPSEWRSMVTLWRAALDADGMQALLTSLTFLDGPPRIRAGGKTMGVAKSKDGADAGEIWYARLLEDWNMEQRTRYGAALWDRFIYEIEEEPRAWVRQISSALISLTVGIDTAYALSAPSKEVPENNVAKVAKLIFNYLKIAPNDSQRNSVLIRYLFDLPQVFKLDQYALARSVLMNPGLLDQVPELTDSRIYGSMIDIIVILGSFDLVGRMKNRDPSHSRPTGEHPDLQRELAGQQAWIMDGDRGPFSPLRCAWRAIRRSRERADFWRWLLSYRRRSRPLLVQAIAAHAGDAAVYVLRTPRAVRQFVARVASGVQGKP